MAKKKTGKQKAVKVKGKVTPISKRNATTRVNTALNKKNVNNKNSWFTIKQKVKSKKVF